MSAIGRWQPFSFQRHDLIQPAWSGQGSAPRCPLPGHIDWSAQMGLMADAKFYRDCACVDRAVAETATLANVRDRALRSAERLEEMAVRTERANARRS